MKNGRFSSKNVSNTVRLTTAGSTSTWPKSGFTVASIVMLLEKPHFRSRPALADPVRPSLNGSPGSAVPLMELRAGDVGEQFEVRLARDGVEAAEFPRQRDHAAVVLPHERPPALLVLALDGLRTTWRPQTWRSDGVNRSCENGMRISATQPFSSIETADSHTPFQVSSSLESLNMTPSPIDPAAVTLKNEPVRWSWRASKATMNRVGHAVGVAVAPRQPLHDLRRLGVEHPRADVDGLVVVEEPDLRRLAGRPAFVRVLLEEVLRGDRPAPVGLGQAAVDRDLLGRGANGGRARARQGRRRLLLRDAARRAGEHQDRRNGHRLQEFSGHATSAEVSTGDDTCV